MKTGVTFDCPCGARHVGLAWGMKAYRHTAPNGGRCAGPADVFTYMLRNAELAACFDDDGQSRRLPTDSEAVSSGRWTSRDLAAIEGITV
ncbi:hypothetical protein ACPXB3_00355 [Gordonia sp. DT219]|uniref:hypothetical protein n=1 Tax=Gordonia sp. DT219 TaxID=3416658 RepID=UPI003CE87E8C